MFWACLLNLGNFAMRMKLTIFFLVNARLYDREIKFVEISMIIRRLYNLAYELIIHMFSICSIYPPEQTPQYLGHCSLT